MSSRGKALTLLGVTMAGLFAVVFLPIGWQLNRLVVAVYYFGRRLGVPKFVTLEAYDFMLNMVLFAVPMALAAWLWPSVRPWVWVLGALVVSTGVEAVQYLALPRDASWVDVASNVSGALAAVLLVRVARRVIAARRDAGVPG